MKWLRGVVAGFAGRKKVGATDIMIDFRSGKPKDPQEAIMAQHFRTYHRLGLHAVMAPAEGDGTPMEGC